MQLDLFIRFIPQSLVRFSVSFQSVPVSVCVLRDHINNGFNSVSFKW